MAAKEEFLEPGDSERWEERLMIYKPNLQTWWCGCISYQQSAYHLCKHLIRLYIGIEGLRSNKPPMPHYGEVWRQSVPPVFWISGIHHPDQLVERDLQGNPEPPIRTGVVEDYHIFREIDQEILPLVYDSDDEEEDVDEDELMVDGDSYEDTWEDTASDNVDIGWGGFFGVSDLEQGETVEEFARREYEGEKILDELQVYLHQLTLVTNAVIDASKYPSSHSHLREIPKPSIYNFPAMVKWAERVESDTKSRKIPVTWSDDRRGVLRK